MLTHSLAAYPVSSSVINGYLCENKDGVHFFTLRFECHNRYKKSYYCVILKMVILHDGIKTIQNSVFLYFSKKRTKTCFFSKKTKKRIKENNNQ